MIRSSTIDICLSDLNVATGFVYVILLKCQHFYAPSLNLNCILQIKTFRNIYVDFEGKLVMKKKRMILLMKGMRKI